MSSHTVKAVSVGALNNSHPLFFNYSEHPDLDQEKEDRTNRAFIFEFRKVVHLLKKTLQKMLYLSNFDDEQNKRL